MALTIEPVLSSSTRRVGRNRKLPQKMSSSDCSVVLQTVGHRTVIDSKDSFKHHVYFGIVDCMLGELESRFSVAATDVMYGIQCLNPCDESFLDLGKMAGFINFYKGNMEDITHEAYQLKRLLQRAKADPPVSSLLDLARFLQPYSVAFQELYRLLVIALVLPVSTASCERSFSTMKLVKTDLRSTMCDDRLSNISVLSVESVRAESIDLDEFVDTFDGRHHNRKLALH